VAPFEAVKSAGISDKQTPETTIIKRSQKTQYKQPAFSQLPSGYGVPRAL
jgi:hypothetical protein